MNYFFARDDSSCPYLLRNLLSCDVCGHRLQGRVQKSGRRIYVCVNGRNPDSLNTPEHVTSIRAAEVEAKVWHSLCQLIADPRRIVDIWRTLYSPKKVPYHTEAERSFRPKQFRAEQSRLEQPRLEQQPALVEIPLHEFGQRVRRAATTSADFQTRYDLLHFLIDQVVVADDALVIEYVVPLRGYGWLARTVDDLSAQARLKVSQIGWSLGQLRLSQLVENGLGGHLLFGQWFATIYLGWLTLAGVMIAVGYTQIGLMLDGGLIVFLLYLTGYMPPSAEARLVWASALPPILRLLSYSVPIPNVSLVVQLGLVGVPALLATLIMMHALRRPLSVYGIRLRNFPVQFAIALIGLLVGVFQWVLFGPQLAVLYADLVGVERTAFISLFITGVTEELVFRGVLQQGALAVFGESGYLGYGLLYANIAFAVMHIGYGPVALLFAFAVGMVYATLVHRTGSIFGVLWAHGLSSMVLLGLMA